uniref:Uncharacterized protein n=1 Tax=Chromera velia CCMP2878 TaxID=1169474 RepID=A0A0G4GGP4_9ALVE|eukprot:Cvel_21825.t1-p1 / transcript=Cvel_21825.t1 / gene=Cvel_21825 / organism=Chromera_velia_CCMP2878 / gene_product=hypothetical protein / transcript_product=hypothetical protein / location=Cvel_scaffold2082:3902-6373(-) / protein_length=692 / sequence_SO=supercontig / SO=protein_coding / is_pseudo=false
MPCLSFPVLSLQASSGECHTEDAELSKFLCSTLIRHGFVVLSLSSEDPATDALQKCSRAFDRFFTNRNEGTLTVTGRRSSGAVGGAGTSGKPPRQPFSHRRTFLEDRAAPGTGFRHWCGLHAPSSAKEVFRVANSVLIPFNVEDPQRQQQSEEKGSGTQNISGSVCVSGPGGPSLVQGQRGGAGLGNSLHKEHLKPSDECAGALPAGALLDIPVILSQPFPCAELRKAAGQAFRVLQTLGLRLLVCILSRLKFDPSSPLPVLADCDATQAMRVGVLSSVRAAQRDGQGWVGSLKGPRSEEEEEEREGGQAKIEADPNNCSLPPSVPPVMTTGNGTESPTDADCFSATDLEGHRALAARAVALRLLCPPSPAASPMRRTSRGDVHLPEEEEVSVSTRRKEKAVTLPGPAESPCAGLSSPPRASVPIVEVEGRDQNDREGPARSKRRRIAPSPTSESSLLSLLSSPLDIFYYPNRKSERNTSREPGEVEEENLDPHRDPGLLTLVPLPEVPGLCVGTPPFLHSHSPSHSEMSRHKDSLRQQPLCQASPLDTCKRMGSSETKRKEDEESEEPPSPFFSSEAAVEEQRETEGPREAQRHDQQGPEAPQPRGVVFQEGDGEGGDCRHCPLPVEACLLADGAAPFQTVVVFPGRALEAISGGVFPALWHSVRRDPDRRPRLSTVFELRPHAAWAPYLS